MTFPRSICTAFALWVAAGAALGQEAETETDFIRYLDGRESSEIEALQTAIVRFSHPEDSVSIDLVSVVHVADPTYFQQINVGLQDYRAVFYELVGGEFSGDAPETPKKTTVRSPNERSMRFLGFEDQRKWIDYTRPNFVHADVTWQELYALMERRNESMTSLFQAAARESGGNGMFQAFVGSLTGADPMTTKRAMARRFAQAEAAMRRVEGAEGTTMIAGRNQRVIEKLRAELQRIRGTKSIEQFAILYGAGHMLDFEKRLAKLGFSQTSVSWLNAWTLTPPKADPTDPAVDEFLKSLRTE